MLFKLRVALDGRHSKHTLSIYVIKANATVIPKTCELMGFGRPVEIDPDLVEWNYRRCEECRSVGIHTERRDWTRCAMVAPWGETPAEVSARVDRNHVRRRE